MDLVNDHKFAKVSSAKILCSILNNIIKVQIRQSLFRQLCFCSEFSKVCTHQSFPLYGIMWQALDQACWVLDIMIMFKLDISKYLIVAVTMAVVMVTMVRIWQVMMKAHDCEMIF